MQMLLQFMENATFHKIYEVPNIKYYRNCYINK